MVSLFCAFPQICTIFPQSLKLNCSTTKPTKWPVCPAKTQISPVWSESLLCAHQSLCCALNRQGFFIRAVKALIRLNRCPGWSVFAGRTGHFVGFVVLQLNFKDFNEGCLILMALMWRITGIWSFVLVKIMARKMARTLYFAYKSLCELQAIYELLAIIQALCSASLTFWMPVL